MPSGAGTTMATLGTPATLAGIAFIRTDAKRRRLPAHAHRLDRRPFRRHLNAEKIGRNFRRRAFDAGYVSMRSRAILRAASVSPGRGSALPRARLRSRANPPWQLCVETLAVSSNNARSPREATSETMLRTTFSTSSATSRLVARRLRKRSGKSALWLSKRSGHDLFLPDPDRLTYAEWVMRALPSTLLRDQKEAYPTD